jgi:hypothetical protein
LDRVPARSSVLLYKHSKLSIWDKGCRPFPIFLPGPFPVTSDGSCLFQSAAAAGLCVFIALVARQAALRFVNLSSETETSEN